jgi:ribosomal protein S8
MYSNSTNFVSYIKYNKIIDQILKIFVDEGFILNYTLEKNNFKITLNPYFPIHNIKQVSKPGNPIYWSHYELRQSGKGKYIPWLLISKKNKLSTWPKKMPSRCGGLVLPKLAHY